MAAIPKGTRDFLPLETIRRKYIFNTIERVFRKYAYRPIETPSLELLSTLTGKYGEEGDRLLFKVLNNGDFLKKADQTALSEQNSSRLAPSIARRGLRYDLTVPFARFVAMNQNDIQFPFKRYQIQPVWRADRPQKGRYQEFYQCDADAVGSDSLIYEAELVQIFDEVFDQLGLSVTLRINNRKILAGIAKTAGVEDKFVSMTVAVDKLDKIGWDGVSTALSKSEFTAQQIKDIQDLFNTPIKELANRFDDGSIGMLGIDELAEVESLLSQSTVHNTIKFDTTLARGLNYYTGFIIEVMANDVSMGSIGAGGRYDDLTGMFGLKGMSGVGISFGAERVYDVLTELNAFPDDLVTDVNIILLPLEDAALKPTFEWLSILRKSGIEAEMYPAPAKIKKQLKYVNARGIQYAGLIGSQEIADQRILLKDLSTGEQKAYELESLIQFLQNPE